jgi:hypothetical protein
VWAGFLWGADGQLPLLISGIVGGVFAIALLALSLWPDSAERVPT